MNFNCDVCGDGDSYKCPCGANVCVICAVEGVDGLFRCSNCHNEFQQLLDKESESAQDEVDRLSEELAIAHRKMGRLINVLPSSKRRLVNEALKGGE